jgi:large subunit ribosomal protein L10
MDHAQKAQMIEKAQIVSDTKLRIEDAKLMILTRNNGVSAEQDRKFRKSLRDEGGSVKIVKNSLAKRALAGTKFEGLSTLLSGPIGIVISQDPVVAARVAHAFAKETNGKLEIVGGASTDGVMDLAKIKYLATLPSLDGLRGKLVGLLQAPGAQLARVTNAYATKDQA